LTPELAWEEGKRNEEKKNTREKRGLGSPREQWNYGNWEGKEITGTPKGGFVPVGGDYPEGATLGSAS